MMTEKKHTGMDPKLAAALGAAAGVAVGVAAVAMADPKKRAQVKKAAQNLGKKARVFAKSVGKKAESLKNEVVDEMGKATKK